MEIVDGSNVDLFDSICDTEVVSVNSEYLHKCTNYISIELNDLRTYAEREGLLADLNSLNGDFTIENLIKNSMSKLIRYYISFHVDYWRVGNSDEIYYLKYTICLSIDESGEIHCFYLETDAN